ncbi:disease resistance protein [Striga asiatica]|uniref:Disease resistance protein n=1 Tax=Striga asiatica TaxID=4170 RepID=A0A5A7QSD1_STRAF|nr:disease resistance protein [Striga asiatica]
MRDQETDRGGNGLSIIGGPSLERSRSSQLSCLGSKERVIEGTQTFYLFSMVMVGVCWGGQGRRIGSRGDAYASSLSIEFPSFAVYGEGDKGEAPNNFIASTSIRH